MQNAIFKSALFIHVLCGAIALITGLIAMSAKKGGKLHNLSGLLYYWAMIIVFITSILFFILFPTNIKYHFFLGIGLVSFYPNWSGKRMLKMKKGLTPKLIDKIGAWVIGISGIIMITYGTYLKLYPNPSFGGLFILFYIFGIVSLTNCYGDLKYYLGYKTAQKMHWFFAHGSKMTGAYAATVTAFCVNIVPRYLPKNSPGFVQIMVWVVPGIASGIIGNIILKRFRVKLKL